MTDTKGLIPDEETGEYVKPYETLWHGRVGQMIMTQQQYVKDTFRDEEDPTKLGRLDPDTLSMVLTELTAMYDSLGKWLAAERLHLADLKTAVDIKFAVQYRKAKQAGGETNETARMLAKIECGDDQKEVDQVKYSFDMVDAWKKSVGRWHDSVRSQLSWEKQAASMGGRQ